MRTHALLCMFVCLDLCTVGGGGAPCIDFGVFLDLCTVMGAHYDTQQHKGDPGTFRWHSASIQLSHQ